MPDRFSRTALLIGREGLEKLANSTVAVFGLGGVGSFVVEGLARAGVAGFYLVDFDLVDVTNINRQLHALTGTVGRSKAALMAERVGQINPGARVISVQERYVPGSGQPLPEGLDYLVDAVDDVGAKVDLIIRALDAGIPVISSMGAGNKLDPGKFQFADISRTSVCPLARTVRRQLAKRGIKKGVKVIFSTEPPLKLHEEGSAADTGSGADDVVKKRPAPGSISFVPPVAGLMIAGEVVRDLLGITPPKAGQKINL